jgi:hypothetical protein
MPSTRALYNDELVQAHREAVATLRELLATETDRAERRKLANALLRAKPVKDAAPRAADETGSALLPAPRGEGAAGSAAADEGSSPSTTHRHAAAVNSADLNHDDHFDDLDRELDDLDDSNDPAMREIDALTHQLHHGPDQLAALHKLQEIMKSNLAAFTPGAAQTP